MKMGALVLAAGLLIATLPPASAEVADPLLQAFIGNTQLLLQRYAAEKAELAKAKKELTCWQKTGVACKAEKPQP